MTADGAMEARVRALIESRDFNTALTLLGETLERSPMDAQAIWLAGEVYAQAGDLAQALGYYALAVKTAPENNLYKEAFIRVAGGVPFGQPSPPMEEALCLCLDTPAVACERAQILWYTLLRAQPDFQPLLEAAAAGTLGDKNLGLLLQPLFLAGLRRIVVCNAEIELFLTALRRTLLENAQTEALPLIDALSHYCFNTDFIFNRTEAEEEAVKSLRHDIERGQATPLGIGLYACYEPLYKLLNAKELAGRADMATAGAIKTQIHGYLDLKARAESIPSLTEIADATSLKVRAQYEEFPYPRWEDLPPRSSCPLPFALDATGTDVLIAGCGTGRQPLSFAARHPQAHITAIDLSRTSLAYAAKKAEELGIKNVTFRHADILQLDTLERTFDGVAANNGFDGIAVVGVLHHMKDPVAGWTVLANLLKPGGTMEIGLYSKAARRHIVTAWEAIRNGGYADTAAGMRRFRKDSPALLGEALRDPVFDTGDYYRLSMYRDLLFHVQEHQFTLPEIGGILENLGLEFLGMNVSAEMLRHFAEWFPDDPQGANLKNWARVEDANPALFTGMYKFWCRKR